MDEEHPTLEYGKEEPPQRDHSIFSATLFVFVAIGIAIILGCIALWIIGYFYPGTS